MLWGKKAAPADQQNTLSKRAAVSRTKIQTDTLRLLASQHDPRVMLPVPHL